MKREEIVNLRKGQRVRLPRYGITGQIVDVQVNSTGRIFAVGGFTTGGSSVYVTADDIELVAA
jgi:hypothetical protein